MSANVAVHAPKVERAPGAPNLRLQECRWNDPWHRNLCPREFQRNNPGRVLGIKKKTTKVGTRKSYLSGLHAAPQSDRLNAEVVRLGLWVKFFCIYLVAVPHPSCFPRSAPSYLFVFLNLKKPGVLGRKVRRWLFPTVWLTESVFKDGTREWKVNSLNSVYSLK